MKVFLDDERPTPPGWTAARWPEEVIALLETGQVTDVSLDHDLGDDARGTGYDVIVWIEEAVAIRGSEETLELQETAPARSEYESSAAK